MTAFFAVLGGFCTTDFLQLVSCGPAAARRRGVEQCERSGFIPACRRWRFFAEILINLFVDKAVPEAELLLLDCAAEPGPGC